MCVCERERERVCEREREFARVRVSLRVCVRVSVSGSVCVSVCILRPDPQTKPEIRWLKKGEVLEGLNIDKVFFFYRKAKSSHS